MINNQGRVLLRQPTGNFDGYAWTFPKGRPEPGESHEQAALREMLEETGHETTIRTRLPGEYEGGTTRNIYFLMEPGRRVQEPDHETAKVRWVNPGEARVLIGQTQSLPGRERDLKLLAAVTNAQKEN